MGIEPDIFGPFLWATIHLVCLGAPEKLTSAQQQIYKSFFYTLPSIIPCSKCATHLKENLDSLPIDDALIGSKELFKWSVELHNIVNSQLKKPLLLYTDALKYWKNIKHNENVATINNKQYNKNKTELFSCCILSKIIYLLIGLLLGLLISLWISN